LRNKKYCILNKQHEKEEYLKIVDKIKKQMIELPYVDKKGRIYKYGEFFPSGLSLWKYNRSWANEFFKLTKEEALDKDFNWEENIIKKPDVITNVNDLPDNIRDMDVSILDKVIRCEHYNLDCNQQCTEFFRILPDEFNFYQQMDLAIPRMCPNCRHFERHKYLDPPKLWHRKCMYNGLGSSNNEYKNTIKHSHGEKDRV
jgi:hypothetical protein